MIGKWYIPVLMLLGLSVFLGAQEVSQEGIMHSGAYYYGSGTAINPKEAKAIALEELVGQISTYVVSDYQSKINEADKDLTEKVTSVLKTYSMAKLKDLQSTIDELPDGRFKAFCYIKKSKVNQIFNLRRKLIQAIARRSRHYEERGNLSAALKLNYYALILMNSLPDEVVQVDSINYTLTIPEAINRILQGIRFKLVRNTSANQVRTITLKITYHDHPVSTLDFSFWDGKNLIEARAMDGMATVKLFGSATRMQSLKIKIKYDYYDERKEYAVINDLWDLVKKPLFKNNSRTIDLTTHSMQSSNRIAVLHAETKNFLSLNKFKVAPQVPDTIVEKIRAETNRLISLLKSTQLTEKDELFKDKPTLRKKYSDYVRFNKPEPLPDTSTIYISPIKDGYELRRIPVLQKYPSIHKFVTQYLVLDFSPTGALQDLNVSINQDLYNHFMQVGQQGNDWPNRQEIIKFIERYRTDYLTRNIPDLDMMFADDALIIVGHRIQRRQLPDDFHYTRINASQPEYELLRLTKKQYLSRLKQVFDRQEDIFLNFESFDIVRTNKPNYVYGVEMRQSYFSTTYADEGYLFLLFDFYYNNPTIYVRAWQPHPKSAAELVRTSNFKIHH